MLGGNFFFFLVKKFFWKKKIEVENFWWKFLEEMSYLISLNPLPFKNIAYIGSWKHFVFVFVCAYVSLSLHLSFSKPAVMSSPLHQIISFQKIYGLYGLKHHTMEINGDVTMETNDERQTNNKVKIVLVNKSTKDC